MTGKSSLRAVAAAAGVSIGSVSRVLNGSGYASKEVRRRVLQAVQDLGYEPNYAARQLRTGQSRTIGYLLANIENPLSAALLSEVERMTRSAGYSLLIGSSQRPARDRELVAFFEQRGLDGIIALPAFEYPDKKACPFSGSRLPTVLVDRDLGPKFDTVLTNHRQGLQQAMNYLFTLGHRRIALFCTADNLYPGREKLHGYREALQAAGFAFDPNLLFMPESWLASSSEKMAELLQIENPPTALIAVGTHMLSGTTHVLRDAGMDLPRDFSVIGYGTADTLSLMYPPITMLRYDFQRSAELAVQLAIERILGAASAEGRRASVDIELVIRGSCGPVRQS